MKVVVPISVLIVCACIVILQIQIDDLRTDIETVDFNQDLLIELVGNVVDEQLDAREHRLYSPEPRQDYPEAIPEGTEEPAIMEDPQGPAVVGLPSGRTAS